MFWEWQPKTTPPKANFIPNDHKYLNNLHGPDADKIAGMGLKAVKAQRALTTYEKNGEPAYDEMGGYKPGQNKVNLAHHTELKKNADKNHSNYSKAAEKFITKDFAPSVSEIYKQRMSDQRTNDIKNALSFMKKRDNRLRAWAYLDGVNGFSASKLREDKARQKHGKRK